MSLLMENSVAKIGCGDPGDPIEFGALFNGGSLSFTPVVSGDDNTWSVSFWEKRIRSVSGSVLDHVFCYGSSAPGIMRLYYYNDRLSLVDSESNEGARNTEALSRDYTGHRHVYIEFGNGIALASGRMRLWIGGREVTSFNLDTAFLLNKALRVMQAGQVQRIGSNGSDTGRFILSEFIHRDGINGTGPTPFGRFNAYGDWVHKRYAGPYGANGFHLDFADPIDLGKDISGNGNDFVVSGSVVQSLDTPSNTLAVVDPNSCSSTITLSNGNLTFDRASNSGYPTGITGIPFSSGAFKAEATKSIGGNVGVFGVARTNGLSAVGSDFSNCDHLVYIDQAGDVRNNGGVVSNGPDWNGTVGFEVNADTSEVYVTRSTGDRVGPFTLSGSGSIVFFTAAHDFSPPISLNFGQAIFAWAYSDEAKPLTLANLKCPETLDPNTLVTVYEGVAASVDLPWNPVTDKTLILSEFLDEVKETRVVDTVRGSSKPFALDTTGAEITTDLDGLTFRAGGYDIGSSSAYTGRRRDYIFRANRLSGMDILDPIVSDGVTPLTAPHQTGGVIHCGWFIPLDGGSRRMFHHELAADQYVRLEDDTVAQTDAGWFGCTANDITVLLPAGRWLPILWTTKDQYSAFTKITGHANGGFAPMDFTPRIAFMRASSTTNGLHLVCSDSSEGNPISKVSPLYTGGVETSEAICDLNSLGIKMRNPSFNPAGQELLISAFALTPGKFATAR